MLKNTLKVLDFIYENHSSRRFSFINVDNYIDYVFLCGKKLTPGDNRHFISEHILPKAGSYALFSETLYQEFAPLNYDLLTIEEILLSISTGTVIIVESFGSACELGAFSFVGENIGKLWVINDIVRKNDGSFISDGPIKKIETAYPEHVMYLNFNKEGIADFDTNAINKLVSLKRTSFKRSPLDFDASTKTCTINDLGFVCCLLFDYVRTFGMIAKDEVFDVLIGINKARDVEKLRIKLPSTNPIEDQETIKTILIKMLAVLEKSHLLVVKKRNKCDYYVLNYQTIQPSSFTSFIFKTNFFNYSFQKSLSKIKNAFIQEGFELW